MSGSEPEESQERGLGARVLDAVDLVQVVEIVGDLGTATLEAAGTVLSAVSEIADA